MKPLVAVTMLLLLLSTCSCAHVGRRGGAALAEPCAGPPTAGPGAAGVGYAGGALALGLGLGAMLAGAGRWLGRRRGLAGMHPAFRRRRLAVATARQLARGQLDARAIGQIEAILRAGPGGRPPLVTLE